METVGLNDSCAQKKKNDSAGVTEFQLRQPKFPVPQRDVKWNRIKRYKVK